MQEDSGGGFEGEHPEGETCHVGDTILVHLYCRIPLIRTPGPQRRMSQLLQNNLAGRSNTSRTEDKC